MKNPPQYVDQDPDACRGLGTDLGDLTQGEEGQRDASERHNIVMQLASEATEGMYKLSCSMQQHHHVLPTAMQLGSSNWQLQKVS